MKRFFSITFCIALVLLFSIISDAQQARREPAFHTIVLKAPDGKTEIPLILAPNDLKEINKLYSVKSSQHGVTYIQLKSWEELSQLAQKSTEAVNRTITDLVFRVSALELRLNAMEFSR